uniref:Transposase n=1 Tax=Romanomermis culicivorax TaxID=13658 RepID=A0A915IWW3_ROMCU
MKNAMKIYFAMLLSKNSDIKTLSFRIKLVMDIVFNGIKNMDRTLRDGKGNTRKAIIKEDNMIFSDKKAGAWVKLRLIPIIITKTGATRWKIFRFCSIVR